MRNRQTVHVDGPRQIQPGNVYVVILYGEGEVVSYCASYLVCLEKARRWNRTRHEHFARVKYVGPAV